MKKNYEEKLKADLFRRLQEEYRLHKLIALQQNSFPQSFSSFSKNVISFGALTEDKKLME